ncbi:hypothetical protein ACJX0J_037831, partial [Zea mays]
FLLYCAYHDRFLIGVLAFQRSNLTCTNLICCSMGGEQESRILPAPGLFDQKINKNYFCSLCDISLDSSAKINNLGAIFVSEYCFHHIVLKSFAAICILLLGMTETSDKMATYRRCHHEYVVILSKKAIKIFSGKYKNIVKNILNNIISCLGYKTSPNDLIFGYLFMLEDIFLQGMQ